MTTPETKASERLLPCRKCGSTDIGMWDGRGTQAEMSCNDCGESDGLQVSDLLDYDVRYAPGNEFSMETLSYPPNIVELARDALIKEWNTRHPAPGVMEDEAVEIMIRAYWNSPFSASTGRTFDEMDDEPFKAEMRAGMRDVYRALAKNTPPLNGGTCSLSEPRLAEAFHGFAGVGGQNNCERCVQMLADIMKAREAFKDIAYAKSYTVHNKPMKLVEIAMQALAALEKYGEKS